MRHHWPVHGCHRPFANQVEGKFVGDQNKNPGAASETLLTGGIDYSHLGRHAGYHQTVRLNCIPEVQILF